MAYWALIAYGVSFAVIFVGRMILQYRRTGNTGFRGISGRPGSAEWLGGVLFLVATVAGVLAPVLQLTGHVAPFTALDRPAVWAVGFVLFGLGLAGTLIAQATMGASWRIGVDVSETCARSTDRQADRELQAQRTAWTLSSASRSARDGLVEFQGNTWSIWTF